MEKRRDHRIHKFLQVQLAHGAEKINGSTIDISPFGMRVRLHHHKVLSPNQMLQASIADHGKSYPVPAQIRWYRCDLVDKSRYVGIAFKNPDPKFCKDVLSLELGGPTLPYRSVYGSHEAFCREYLENIIYGGLLMRCDNTLPQLYQQVFVELVVPGKHDSFKLQGEVVAHVPGGFGLKLSDMSDCKRRLNAWMNRKTAVAI